ncbi:MAG: PLP-dependent cysteine synthase family protein [Gemmatimonadota bacterium]|nr:PLP-dependent cysteine synthase family protein [Gemmatimonadota bacterium]
MSNRIRLPAALDPADRLKGLRVMVGNTPLLAISLQFSGQYRTIYVKAENLNLTGSIKDRMALHIVRRGYESGRLVPGGRIVEATSGNTGISFAAIGRAMGHPVTIFMPDWMSGERRALIRSFGADIRLVSADEGGFVGSIQLAEEFAAETPGAFLPRQFANEDNVEAHQLTTGPELRSQLAHSLAPPDAFVAGVGTGGTIMGVGKCLRAGGPVRLHPVEPENSPTLSTGCRVGHHRIQGISDEFIPPIVRLDDLDEVISVDDGDAICMAQKLASTLGLGVGISSGANLLAALKVQDSMGGDAIVATVFPDSNKKYLSTDLLNYEPEQAGHLTPHVSLTGFRAMGRVCDVCFDATDPASLPVPPSKGRPANGS